MVAAAAPVPGPIQIPGQSLHRKREPSGAKNTQRRGHGHGHGHGHPQSPALAVAASVVLVTLVAMEIWAPYDTTDDVKEWRFWVVRLVFPSQHITWAKLVGLALGFVLTTSYFLSSQAQLASAEQMMIHSATVLVSPLRRSPTKSMATDPNAPTPTGKTTAAWIASRCHSFLHKEHAGGDQAPNSDLHDEIPQLKIRDECKPLPWTECSDFEAVNRAQPLAFESDYFSGHVLFMVKNNESATGTWAHLFGAKKRMLWVQIQGRFKQPLPSQAVLYVATELPKADGFQLAFLTRQLVSLLVALVKTFVPMAHIAFGEKVTANAEESELPHAAFPLYQTVDEFVVTDASESDKTPSFGQESFGESAEAKRVRLSTPVGMAPAIRMDATYSFQFHTMYADLAQWKIVNVPGMPDMDLRRFCGSQAIRLAIYTIATPGLDVEEAYGVPHRIKDKGYVFCFSMHHRLDRLFDTVRNPAVHSKETDVAVTTKSVLSPIPRTVWSPSLPPRSPMRWRSVSCDQPDAVVRQQTRHAVATHAKEEQVSEVAMAESRPQPRIRASSSVRNMTSLERAADLSNWKFSLPLWIERVDPAAGNRKVAYLLVVEERHAARPIRRCVVRSAHTVKNALLLLDATTTDMSEQTNRAFKKLIVESREFLYDSISRETERVAQALQAIAAIPSAGATESDRDKQAMLFNCLMSESQLPCIRSYQDIGVQLAKTKRDHMDIIFEKGIYRMPNPQFLRQEWFILTTTELLFFRSFTLKPSKTISLAHVLGVRSIDNVPFFEPTAGSDNPHVVEEKSPRQRVREVAMRSTNRWVCVEIHLLREIVTVFFDSASDRALCVLSLTQLINLKAGASSVNGLGRLPPCRSLDAVTTPVCCNDRKMLPGTWGLQARGLNPVVLAEEMVERGLLLFSRPRSEAVAADVVAFLDAVDQLCEVSFSIATIHALSADTILEDGSETSHADSAGLACWFSTNESRIAFALNLFHGLYIHAWLLFGDVRSHAQWKKRKSMVFYAIGNPRSPRSQVRVTLGDIEHTILKGSVGPGEEYSNSSPAATLPFSITTPLPAYWRPQERDFRTSFALQTNSGPSAACVLRVYHAATLSSELNETCSAYLEKEVVVDDLHRVLYLPTICEWNLDDFVNGSSIVQTGSREFFCLQKLLPLMHTLQHDRIQHLLLGAGKEYQIRFSPKFWTQDLRTLQLDGVSASSFSEASRAATGQARDDIAVAPAGLKIAETSEGIPRSKSALQFFQSLF